MDEQDDEKMIDYIAQTLRDEPMRKLSPSFDAKVMAAIKWGEVERPSRAKAVTSWFVRPRSISLSPLTGLAAAASIAAFAYLGAGAAMRSMLAGVQPAQTVATTAQTQASAMQMVQFVLVAPDARSVSLVGDFNDWNAKATPLASTSGNLWTVQIPLTAGRYNYIFMVDGTRLVPDPRAPTAPADEFGQPNSVITVGSSSDE